MIDDWSTVFLLGAFFQEPSGVAIVIRILSCGAALLSYAILCSSFVNAQKAARSFPVPAQKLESFLASNSGPVIDVRMAGDCSDEFLLKRKHVLLGFDSTMPEGDARIMTEDAFVAAVRANKSLVRAKSANQTILLVCCVGGRAEAAAKLLAKHGFRTAFVPWGLRADAVPPSLLRR